MGKKNSKVLSGRLHFRVELKASRCFATGKAFLGLDKPIARLGKGKGGFSLLEALIVLSIFGIIMAISVPRLMKAREVTQEIACKASIESVSSALELYFTKYQTYPDSLSELVKDGYLQEKALKDSWGNPFLYQTRIEGKKVRSYRIGSSGPDGIVGTVDDVRADF